LNTNKEIGLPKRGFTSPVMADPIRRPFPEVRLKLPFRLGLLAALLFVEKLGLGGLVDSGRARDAAGFGAVVHSAQHWGFRFLVTFLAVASVLAYVRAREQADWRGLTEPLPELRFRWILLHGLLVAILAAVSYALYRGQPASLLFAAMVIGWVVVAAAAVLAALLGLAPAATWLRGIRSLGVGWLYAGVAALLGTGIWEQSEKLWTSAAALTFQLVKIVLTPILPTMSTDASTQVIRTDHFAVQIAEACSGLEGLGLTLAFSVMWLLYFRREYIFPRALVLIPISLAAIFGLNVVRIAALMLIGNAGFPDVASYGFHSQAGWIAFNAVACGLVFFSRRSPWLNRMAQGTVDSTPTHNPTAVYLVPLLAILTAGVLSHAMSGRFETLYPLRLIAAAAALTIYGRDLVRLDWTFSWRGPLVGALVFVGWAAAAYALLPHTGMPDALTALAPLARTVWISSRALAAIVTVPIAEELAYRGYLMRRFGRADFESLPYRSVGWPAMVGAAVLFGAGHGTLWLPGIAAGAAYGWLVVRYGRLGEAVAAHATTNALIVIGVLAGNQWQLW
jgi:exosortase E/protease (VPEID-CTERM system)